MIIFQNCYINHAINFLHLYTFLEKVALRITIASTLNFYLGRKQGHWEATSNICKEKLARFSLQIPIFLTARRGARILRICDRGCFFADAYEKRKVNLTILLSKACDFITRIVCVDDSPARKSRILPLLSLAH